MGASSDIMHDFASQEIKRVYSSSDGWTVTSRTQENNYDAVFRLERLNDSRREIVKVGVTFAKEINPALIETIKVPERASDGVVSRFSSSLVVPANVDTAALPGTVMVYQMKSFAFDGENLVWLKKPVRKTDNSSQKVAAN